MLKVLATGSKGNCYLLQAGNDKLLLECGIPYKEILKGLDFNLNGVQGCLISHEHLWLDHCKSVNQIMKAGIDVYMSEGTAAGIEFKNHIYDYRVNTVKDDIFHVGNFKVLPFRVQHDTNEPLGFLIYHKDIGKVLFVTDTYYLKFIFHNVDHILVECNYSERDIKDLPDYKVRVLKSHLSLETLQESLMLWDLEKTKTITLIHLSEANGDPELFKKEIEFTTGKRTFIAVPGLEVV